MAESTGKVEGVPVSEPAVIGVGMLLLGVIFLFAWRAYKREPFFRPRPAVAGGSR